MDGEWEYVVEQWMCHDVGQEKCYDVCQEWMCHDVGWSTYCDVCQVGDVESLAKTDD